MNSSYPPDILHAGCCGPPKDQCNQHRNADKKGFARQDLSFSLWRYQYTKENVTRSQYKLRKWFKGCLKEFLAACHIENPKWLLVIEIREDLQFIKILSSMDIEWVVHMSSVDLGSDINAAIHTFLFEFCCRICLSKTALLATKDILVGVWQITISIILEINNSRDILENPQKTLDFYLLHE